MTASDVGTRPSIVASDLSLSRDQGHDGPADDRCGEQQADGVSVHPWLRRDCRCPDIRSSHTTGVTRVHDTPYAIVSMGVR